MASRASCRRSRWPRRWRPLAQGELVVYCTVQEEWCRPMVAAFEKATGIKVLMTRKSSGEFYAQIKAEAANPAGRHLVGRHRRPAPAGGGGGPHRAVQVAEARRAPGLGGAPVGAVEGPHRRRLRRRARLQLQHRAAQEEEHPRAQVLVRPHQARVQGRGPGGEPEFVGHVVHDARDAGAADGRGQGVRLPEGAAQERQPVHQVGRGAGARGGHRREHWSASRSSTTPWCRRSAARRSRSCRRAKAPATRSAA